MAVKQALYQYCLNFVERRYTAVCKLISGLEESLASETKSSAGDKHETGRAMLQLEREKAGQQLAEAEKTKQVLLKINVENTPKGIGLGSVVYTTQANYFIAISAGQLTVEGETFYAISANTPIGQLLMGKKEGQEVVFRNQAFKIVKVL